MRPTAILLGVLFATAPVTAEKATKSEATMPPTEQLAANPVVAEWTGPYDGVPPFDRVEVAHLEPAFDAAMGEYLDEIDRIASNPEPPTFENTIVARERAGAAYDRFAAIYGVQSANVSTPEFREAQSRIAPKLAELRTKLLQHEELFARIEAVHGGEEMETLSPVQRRLVELVHDSFARNGATLDADQKSRYSEIQTRLAELHTRFANNVLADEEKYVVTFDESRAGGLPKSVLSAAAAAAKARGVEAPYAILNTRSSADPFLTYSDDRELREQVWRNFVRRGDNDDENDNKAIIAEILALRDERVELLGYGNYAEWRLGDRMARTPERAMELMEAVWPAATARVAEEVADMQALVDAEAEAAGTEPFRIEPWDYRYYMEKVRKARYDLDSDEVKQYLQLDRLREAMFLVAERLFGFTFTPVPEGKVPVFHGDVRVWEVRDVDSERLVGLWYLDPYARSGKRSGAWATSYRGYDTLDGPDGEVILASNNSNFIAGPPGEPVLVSWDDATTFFHEFGHALHSLSTTVDYPTFNIGVRDYTEFQSQLLERWITTEPVVEAYLVHVETGEPMPEELLAKIQRASTFNQGFSTTEYLASALVDMAFHTADPEGLDPRAFEKATLDRLGMPSELVMRHRPTHFGHIFSGEGYSAGYYGYMWADVLTSDAAEAFAEAPGGFYDETLAKKLVENLFAVRNAVDPAEAYRLFRGRDATIDALMRDRGFPVPSAAAGR